MPWRNRKTAILGASGFLGRNLCDYFAQRDWPFLAVTRDQGDLTDPGTVREIFANLGSVDTIFHLATFQRTGFRQYEIPADLLSINARMHLNVLGAWQAQAPGALLVSTGSSCFYPESETPLAELAFQTGPLHESVRAYGLAKSMLAVGCDAMATQYGMRWLHCVLATMYGPHGHTEPDRSHFIGGMLNRALQQQQAGESQFTVWGNPDTVREVLYVTDQIEAILSATEHFSNRILNCAANQETTIGETAEAIRTVLEWGVPVVYPPDTFKGTSRKTLDSSVFLQASGWNPKVSLLDGLRTTAQHLTGAKL